MHRSPLMSVAAGALLLVVLSLPTRSTAADSGGYEETVYYGER